VSYLSFIKKSFSISPSTLKEDIFSKKDPHEFRATGSQIYHGRQRQGKTLGLMYGFHKLKRRYPRLLIVSNLTIKYLIRYENKKFLFFTYKSAYKYELIPVLVATEQQLNAITSLDEFKAGTWQQKHYIRYQTYDQLLMLLRKARNGIWGVDFIIDEIHQYFHSHDSKSMPVWVAQIFSQQMKQYILVTGTVQKWENVIKALREQIEHLILSQRSGWFIRQTVIDPEDIESEYGEQTAVVKKTGRFFMSKLVRESYDTLALIESGREIFGGGVESPNIIINTDQQQKPKFGYNKRKSLKKYGV